MEEIQNLSRCESGATVVEYALIAAFIAVNIVIGLVAIPGPISDVLTKLAGLL